MDRRAHSIHFGENVMFLSKHFSLEELTESDTAIRKGLDNTPSNEALGNLYTLAEGLERVRTTLHEAPIIIKSGYRSPKVNAIIGGNKKSQHIQGLAADFIAPSFGDPKSICETIIDHEDFVGFDQLIHEGTWVHISFSSNPRGEILTAHFNSSGVYYSKGLA